MITAKSESRTLQRVLEDEIEPFLRRLRATRYTNETLQRKRTITKEFSQWAQQHRIIGDNIDSNTAAEFVGRLRQTTKTRAALERATVRLFLKHLYARGRLRCITPKETESVSCRYLRRYEEYLRKDRGLADNSVHVYVPFVRDFLSTQAI